MRIQFKSAREAASALIVSVFIALVIGATLASYLLLVESQSKAVARSQLWNSSIVVAEAGIEDGLQFINKYAGTKYLDNWPNFYWADGWSKDGNVFSVTRYLDAAHTSYYRVYVTNVPPAPAILSTGFVPGPSWRGAGTMSRTVFVQTKVDALFDVCMAALGQIDLRGNGIATDSFDSSAPEYPGHWTNTIRRAGADVVTNGQITNSTLNVGNANIAGKVKTGPEGVIQIGPNGSVGSLPWVDAPTPGVEPGWSANDFNVIFEDVVMPKTLWLAAPGGATVDGIYYDHVFTTSGDYQMPDSGDIYVETNVAVRLNITIKKYDPNRIYVAGIGNESGKFTGYLNGPPAQSCTLGTDDKSQSGIAGGLTFFGMPNCTTIAYKGNGDFTGVIYAPQADFQLAGGGSSIIDFIGSSVTKTVQMNGHYRFHYDENLRNSGDNRGFIPQYWREFRNP